MAKHLATAAAFMMAVAETSGARAQDYPTRTVTVIVPFAAGGPADITGQDRRRYLYPSSRPEICGGERLGGRWHHGDASCRPRGGRRIHDPVRSPRYQCAGAGVLPTSGYDPQKDFEPIGLTVEYPELLVVRKDFPANSLKEFVAYAKSNPDKLNVGHAGLGSVSYIGGLLLHAAIGIKPTMISFTGTAPVLNAMLSGQVDYECDPALGTLSQVQAGNVKALAIAAKKRSPLLPDVPTSHEQGLPEFDIAPFYGVFGPRGTPQAVVEKLADALSKGLNEEAVQKRLTELRTDRRAARPPRTKSPCRIWSKAKPRG